MSAGRNPRSAPRPRRADRRSSAIPGRTRSKCDSGAGAGRRCWPRGAGEGRTRRPCSVERRSYGPAATRSPRHRPRSREVRPIPSISRPAAATSPRNAGRSSGGHTRRGASRCRPSRAPPAHREPRSRGARARRASRRSGVSRCAARRPPRPVGTPTARGSGLMPRSQLETLLDQRDAAPRRAALERRAGDRDRPVAVRVGLDHGHQLGVGWLERGRVAADRARSTSTVVGRKRVSVMAPPPRARSRRAGGRPRRRRPCRRPCGRRRRGPASPWR